VPENKFMKPEYRNLKVTLADIARDGAIGPIAVGADLTDIGDILGPPRYWGFPGYEDFDAYMGFGEAEIGFETKDNKVLVRRIQVDMLSCEKVKIPICRGVRFGAKMSIKAPPYDDRRPEPIRELLRAAGLRWSEEIQYRIIEETVVIMSFMSGVQFYFRQMDDVFLEGIVIHDMSWYEFRSFVD